MRVSLLKGRGHSHLHYSSHSPEKAVRRSDESLPVFRRLLPAACLGRCWKQKLFTGCRWAPKSRKTSPTARRGACFKIRRLRACAALSECVRTPVSYTHLDVYKRQHAGCSSAGVRPRHCPGRGRTPRRRCRAIVRRGGRVVRRRRAGRALSLIHIWYVSVAATTSSTTTSPRPSDNRRHAEQ